MKLFKLLAELTLGAFLTFAGIAHLSFGRSDFQAQVPDWVGLEPDFVVLASGVVEIGLGLALILTKKRKAWAGIAAALFFIAIFPGNISQYLTGTDAFGLNSDSARLIRLFFQPILVLWAMWSTSAWQQIRRVF
jgi:uncharacterized membrane protein